MRLCRALMIGSLSLLALIAFAAALHYPWLFVVAGLCLVLQIRKSWPELTAFGTARWASTSDLARAGMLGGSGLPLGKISLGRARFWPSLKALFESSVPAAEACERFMRSMRKLQRTEPETVTVRLNKAVHTAVFAPTGTGKGVSLVIPFLLECRDSCVVIDPKGENAKLTAARRRAMGQRVVILDPYKVVTQEPDTFNPLDAIDNDSPTALDDLRALAKELVVRTGAEPDPHWNDNAESEITATSAAVCIYQKGADRSLQSVRTLLTNHQERTWAIEAMRKSKAWGGMLERLGNQSANFRDKELSGVLSTANRHLTFLDTPAVSANTATSSFTISDLPKGGMTVYLVLPPEYLKSQAALLRLWIGSTLRACIRNGLQEETKTHFVLDEAASLGQMEVLESAVDKLRGWGVRLQFYFQSMGQLRACWRDGLDQTLLSNVSSIYFGVNEYATAEHVSNQLGETTIIVDSGGTNQGGSRSSQSPTPSSTHGESWGSSSNWQQQARRLLKPEEVMTLDPRMAITFTPGIRPIMTYLTRYYEQPAGKEQGRWHRLQTTAEVWATAILMLLLSALGAWAAGSIHPQ